MRVALSMLELIFVIVILGIVASVGAEVIAKVYESYIVQTAQYRATTKVEDTLTQIANRLNNAIPGTVVRRITTTGTAEEITTPLGGNADDYTVLQWVGKDADSFEAITSTGNMLPGWSGFCDLDASLNTTVKSPGSNFTLASGVIANLGGTIDNNAHIYFSGKSTPSTVQSVSGDVITLTAAPAEKVEHYKLAWSSYALSVESGDLWLYHHFAPTPAATIAGTRTLLLKNVTNFKFRGDGRTIRVKFCVNERIGDGYIPSCSERAVF